MSDSDSNSNNNNNDNDNIPFKIDGQTVLINRKYMYENINHMFLDSEGKPFLQHNGYMGNSTDPDYSWQEYIGVEKLQSDPDPISIAGMSLVFGLTYLLSRLVLR